MNAQEYLSYICLVLVDNILLKSLLLQSNGFYEKSRNGKCIFEKKIYI